MSLAHWIKESGYKLGIDMVGIVSAKAIDEYAGMWADWKNSGLRKTTDQDLALIVNQEGLDVYAGYPFISYK